jgi:hypothetical protein
MLLLILICVLNIKPILNKASDTFWDVISNQLEKEEKEREEMTANHEIVRGKDTVLIWNNMYEIGHFSDGNHLSIQTENISDNILEKISKYKVRKKKLYIKSEEGYAVIDENNICRVFITVPADDFVNGYSEDEYGNRTYISRFIEDEHIIYLESYDDFSEDERKIFGKSALAL